MKNKTSMLAIAIAVPILAGLILGYLKWALMRDFKRICEHETQMKTAADTERLINELRHPQVKAAMDAIAQADPKNRADLLRTTANELGFTGWECPAVPGRTDP